MKVKAIMTFAAGIIWVLLVTVVNIPGRLLEAIRRRGFDPESFIVDTIEEKLGLDPREELETRIAVAEHMLRRAREELEKVMLFKHLRSSTRPSRSASRY